MSLLDELRDATRRRADVSLLAGGPRTRGWDHALKCMTRPEAERSRAGLRVSVGNLVQGRRVKWRVRECVVCHRFYVDCDGSSTGDRAGQRQRAKERKRLANENREVDQ